MAREKILIINKDESILVSYSFSLREAGFRITTARSGIKALNLLSNHSFDLVITDVAMKNGSGFNLLGTIKAMYPHLPVLAVTHETSEKLVSFSGTYSIIEKPSLNELITCSTCVLHAHTNTPLQCTPWSSCRYFLKRSLDCVS